MRYRNCGWDDSCCTHGRFAPEQLEHLSRLRDQGILTEEEFAAKKTELLGRM